MRKRWLVLVAGILASDVHAAPSMQATPAPAPSPAASPRPVGGKDPVLWSATDIQWTDVPESKGLKQAILWGDPATRGYGALNRWPAGFQQPLHHHTFDVKALVLAGTLVMALEGAAAKEFPPGSYVMLPGRLKHTTGCKAGAECVFFAEQSLRYDMAVAEPAK
ncbi:MAG TPA: DUF4437 domain-containing protein [Vicinamibacteria bacterium]|jgi:hypothetical protein